MAKTKAFNSFANEYDAWFEKESLIYELELKVVKGMLVEKGKGIEIGSGTGRFSLPNNIRIGIEPSLQMGKIAVEKGIEVICGSAESLPVKSESFNFVLYNTVLCFFDSLRMSFLESYRILRPGGAIITGFIDKESYLGKIYNKKKEESRFFGGANFYSVPEISRILTESGYESLEYAQTLIFDLSNNSLSEKISAGYGEGSFVVIKGYK